MLPSRVATFATVVLALSGCVTGDPATPTTSTTPTTGTMSASPTDVASPTPTPAFAPLETAVHRALEVLDDLPDDERDLYTDRAELLLVSLPISGPDPFDGMNVEDAVLAMFLMVSQDARDDMRELLEDMRTTDMERDALREALRDVEKQTDALQDKLAREWSDRDENDAVQGYERRSVVVLMGNGTKARHPFLPPVTGPVDVSFNCPDDVSPNAPPFVEVFLKDIPSETGVGSDKGNEDVVVTADDPPSNTSIKIEVTLHALPAGIRVECELGYDARDEPPARDPADAEALAALLDDLHANVYEILAEADDLQGELYDDDLAFLNEVLVPTILRATNWWAGLTPVLQGDDTPAQPDGGTLDDLAGAVSLRLQQQSDRRSQAFDKLSDLLTKHAETQASIVANMK